MEEAMKAVNIVPDSRYVCPLCRGWCDGKRKTLTVGVKTMEVCKDCYDEWGLGKPKTRTDGR